MNKTELIAAMVEASGLTKKDCEAALTAFTGALETAMKVSLRPVQGVRFLYYVSFSCSSCV